MNRRIQILLLISVVLLTGIVSGVGVLSENGTGATVDASVTNDELFSDALQQPASTNYKITYLTRSNGTERTVGIRKVDNKNERYYWEVYDVDPERRGYGTPVSRWETNERTDEWRMITTSDRSINHFSTVQDIPSGAVHVVQENESRIVLEVDDPDVIVDVMSGSYFVGSPYVNQSWLRVHINKKTGRLDRVEYYTQDVGDDDLFQIMNYSGYGKTTVERPESIPFSLHERIRLLLYKLGLI